MSAQEKCICCEADWKWDCQAIFNFSIPIGKRVWPALCPECRTQLETKYKCGEMTRAELTLEFSNISGRIAKLCTGKVKPDILQSANNEFRPKRRGKH